MTTISDLSCTGNNGQPIHGTAAILHRLFATKNSPTKEEIRAEYDEYRRLLKECHYTAFDD